MKTWVFFKKNFSDVLVCHIPHKYSKEMSKKSVNVSLSTVVLNSRDWSEIVWLPKILCFKNQPCNRLYPKKPTGMHWLCYNDAVSWLNEAKT